VPAEDYPPQTLRAKLLPALYPLTTIVNQYRSVLTCPAVQWSLNDSLKKLKLDYVDLFLVHWPIAAERTDDYNPKIGPDGKV
jgi:predicted oxidoreductase